MARGLYDVAFYLALCLVVIPLNTISSQAENVFTLRRVLQHGIDRNENQLIQKVISEDAVQAKDLGFRIKTRTHPIQRLADRRPETIENILANARAQDTCVSQPWVVDDIKAPDITDRDTVINFALMAANAYTLIPGTDDWEDLDKQFGYNTSLDFGWNSNGLRGHLYTDESNSTVIIGIKGTSRAIYGSDDDTTNADKDNDNLYFSCCCAQQGQWTYRQVCNCATSTYNCNSTCLDQNLRQDHRYYQAARYLFANVTAIYPNSNIWVTGHSLGGAVSSLLGLTYGLPSIAFEAPPEALAASRLGIPAPPGGSYAQEMSGTYHFGHTADPIYMGTCNGATASCSYYGYAFETQCHAGMICTYDTVVDHGWRVSILRHGIRNVITDVLRSYDSVPTCIPDDQCVDCFLWKFYESNSSQTTTTSSSFISTRSHTRTATCETPGWWGCRDVTTTTSTTSTTTSTSTSTSIISTSTSTCKTPGWFWCKDKPTGILLTPAITAPAHAVPFLTQRTYMPSPSGQLEVVPGNANDET